MTVVGSIARALPPPSTMPAPTALVSATADQERPPGAPLPAGDWRTLVRAPGLPDMDPVQELGVATPWPDVVPGPSRLCPTRGAGRRRADLPFLRCGDYRAGPTRAGIRRSRDAGSGRVRARYGQNPPGPGRPVHRGGGCIPCDSDGHQGRTIESGSGTTPVVAHACTSSERVGVRSIDRCCCARYNSQPDP